MKALFAAALAASFFVPVSLGMAAGVSPVVDNGVIGVLSPNGTFKPLATSTTLTGTQTTKIFTGVINTTINIVATTPVTGVLQCSISAAVTGISSAGLADTVIDTVTGIATGSGTSYTCVTALPYKWGLFASASTATVKDSVQMTYQLNSIGGAGGRIVSSSFDVMAVPAATGATTNFTINARI